MSRPLRLDLAGAIHHVTVRGNAREPVFRDGSDRTRWQETLERTVERFSWLVLAYCQMGNHYHLLVETPQPNLSRGMRQLNGVYAERFNGRHGRVGHLFQARFHATLVERDEHLLAVAAYVPLNPVRAGLCGKPEDWRWSSYRATIGLETPSFLASDRLLSFFGEERVQAREHYRAAVETRAADEPLLSLGGGVIFGSGDFADAHTRGLEPSAEVPRRHWQPVRSSLDELLSAGSNARIAAAHTEYGYTMREIADHLGLHYATISRRIRRHEAEVSECKT